MPGSRQPTREVWSRERLYRERALALGFALDKSTLNSYGSALNSYLNFIYLHNFPVEPTPDTLSCFTVYMSHYINPRSVDSYLSGICQQLEDQFPEIRKIRSSPLVKRTLQGCLKMKATPTKRKHPLSPEDLNHVATYYFNSEDHDDLLFLALLYTGVFGLMRLGELTLPDDSSLIDWRKVTRRSTLKLYAEHYGFVLPHHKADRFFEGNNVLVRGFHPNVNPINYFMNYIASQDRLMPLASPLWLTKVGEIPRRSFFIRRLHIFFDNDFGGQSMRATGATLLAELGTPPMIIQGMGRWSSEAFRIYIRKNPAILQALIYARHDTV